MARTKTSGSGSGSGGRAKGPTPKPPPPPPPPSRHTPNHSTPRLPPLGLSRTCKLCKWWQEADGGPTVSPKDGPVQCGECRATGPLPGDDDAAVWPITREDDWCREWEPGPWY